MFALIVGVALIGVAIAETDQSGLVSPLEQPIAEQENVGKRRMETPEVVLQLKYDGGELNRVYLAQYRKPSPSWIPSVTDRTNLCADLCHAGLGGPMCGDGCKAMIPVGLQSALNNSHTVSDTPAGQARVNVCPALCPNFMGMPLCQCGETDSMKSKIVDWTQICDAFCADGYTLGGCPACAPEPPAAPPLRSRVLSTADGWSAWCDVQCRQGHGGAACNCDRTPFL